MQRKFGVWELASLAKHTNNKHILFRAIITHSFRIALDIVLLTGLRCRSRASKPSQKLDAL